ncbi:MAG: hypothetical protein JW801_12590 [Bacteroidales bacterium]|nr:hypothetical protein [Bacteroidales bacterium]
MTKLRSILSEKQLISSAETDFTKRLSLSSLVNLHIQIAWHHAEHLGYGKDFLHENGLVWMLSRLHIKIDQYPEWNEMINLESWPKGIRRLFYMRDFHFRDLSGKTVSKATSEWLIINWKAKRPKLYNPDNNVFNENMDRYALEGAVPELAPPDNQPELFHNRVVYSDIDLNQHLTTTRYIEWMLDCFDMEYLKQHQCNELIVNFIKEIPYGTEVLISRYPANTLNSYLYEYCLPNDQTLCFRGQVSFSE